MAALTDDGGGLDGVRSALAAVQGREVFAGAADRLHGLAVELDDVAAELRGQAEAIEDDPERLAWIGDRRAQLRELRRKYGDSLAEVLAFHGEAEERLGELEGYEGRAAALDGERVEAVAAVDAEAERVGEARRAAAPRLARAVGDHLRQLAMPRARLDVAVDGGPTLATR